MIFESPKVRFGTYITSAICSKRAWVALQGCFIIFKHTPTLQTICVYWTYLTVVSTGCYIERFAVVMIMHWYDT